MIKGVGDILEGINNFFLPIALYCFLTCLLLIRCLNCQNIALFIGYGLILYGNDSTNIYIPINYV